MYRAFPYPELFFWSITEQTFVISNFSNEFQKYLNLIFTFDVCVVLRKNSINSMLC